jgi:AcrR family transcriptional regulator
MRLAMHEPQKPSIIKLIKRLIRKSQVQSKSRSGSARKLPAKPRGRPGESDAGDVRGAILEVAETLFANRGYAATSLRTIANAAGVTPAMIHYYFGSKETLLRKVLEKAVEPLAATIAAMQSAQEVAPEEIAASLTDLVARHPKLPYLVIREVMLPGGVMREHFARHLGPRLGGALPGLLAREARAGRIRGDLPPEVGALVIMSLALFPFIVRPVAEQVLNIRLSGDDLADFQAHLSEFVLRGFSP